MDPRLAFNFNDFKISLKLSWFLEYIVLNLFLFSHDYFLIFHNTVMIYNTRNWSNYTTESQKEKKTCFNAHAGRKWNLNAQCMQTSLKGVYSWNKMWSLKSLVMLKCESWTSLHAVQYKWQSGSVLMFCGTASLALFLACS